MKLHYLFEQRESTRREILSNVIVIDSTYVYHQFISLHVDGVQYGEVWIQGERIDGTWVYDDGTPFTFSNWNTGEGWFAPNKVVIIRKTEGYKWHDAA